ncbi:MAG: hypothetical protein JNM80_09870 [Phycisphaerae bacterium]|nr:hypothetical protein [Phycisphaerae bacterium]
MKNQIAALVAVAGFAAQAWAQSAPIASRNVAWKADSGVVAAPGKGDAARVVYSTTVFVPNAPWVRVRFKDVVLAGRVEEGNASYLRITSLLDGGTQYLNSVSVKQWANATAYFNGDAVLVELLAYPGTGPNRLVISGAIAGEEVAYGQGPDSICGPTDDRTLLNDVRNARHVPEGCSSWLHDDTNRMFLTAGHCGVSAGDTQQFNVPLSTSGGSIVNPPPEDQYPVDASSLQTQSGSATIGSDFAYFATFVNSNTGLTPFQRYGQFYIKSATAPAVAGQTIRITGYGTTSSPVSPTWNQVGKTHTGPYTSLSVNTIRYAVDTTGGNSGSAVHNLATDQIIGIHTNAGCTSSAGTANNGGAIHQPQLVTALANPRTLCLTGRGTVTPPLYAIGDAVNNFGTLNTTTGNFAKVKDAPPRMEGLAYNWTTGLFFAVSNDTYGVAPGAAGRKLWTINPATGNATYVANITGAAGVINGLGYDPTAGVLYGIVQATGQLVTINTASGVATTLGPANGGTVGGLEFNPSNNTLYGVNDAGGATSLVRFNLPAGTMVTIGALGAGITDCNGLGVVANGDLYTVNAATEQLLRINPATGAATLVGATGGIFEASFGISAEIAPPSGSSCYANCDASTTLPFLNVNDFICFQNLFATGDSRANCDGSTNPPVLNVNDFTCFNNAFAAGCSAP